MTKLKTIIPWIFLILTLVGTLCLLLINSSSNNSSNIFFPEIKCLEEATIIKLISVSRAGGGQVFYYETDKGYQRYDNLRNPGEKECVKWQGKISL